MPLSDKINLLDHGFIRLCDHMGSDLSIVRSARVSHDAAWRTGVDEGSDERLIRYLWKHRHTTPFESVTFTFEVKAPIFVFRQWHRHRTFSYNELSAWYRELPTEYYVPDEKLIGMQSTTNRQISDRSNSKEEIQAYQFATVNLLNLMEFWSLQSDKHAQYEIRIYSDAMRELVRPLVPVAVSAWETNK